VFFRQFLSKFWLPIIFKSESRQSDYVVASEIINYQISKEQVSNCPNQISDRKLQFYHMCSESTTNLSAHSVSHTKTFVAMFSSFCLSQPLRYSGVFITLFLFIYYYFHLGKKNQNTLTKVLMPVHRIIDCYLERNLAFRMLLPNPPPPSLSLSHTHTQEKIQKIYIFKRNLKK